jgi:hypothetical protein
MFHKTGAAMRAVELAYRAAVPALLWGPPGVGKTASIRALGARLGVPVVEVITSIREPSDFLGLPVVVDGGVKYVPPSWAEELAGGGILFFDEISTAPPAVQAALLRVVLERRVGEHQLSDSVWVVAAANPPDQAAGGWDLAPPLANRFIHLNWRHDAMRWAEEFPAYFATSAQNRAAAGVVVRPGVDAAAWAQARALVAAFIRVRPHLLLQMPTDAERAGRAWASPRTWDFASRVLAVALEDSGGRVEAAVLDAAECVAGCVGEGPAGEFVTWARAADLPDPEELLADPSSFRLPERGDIAYAVLSAVATAVVSRCTAERWAAAWEILGRAAEQGAKDIAAAAARQLARLRREKPELELPLPVQIFQFVPFLKEVGLL